MFVIPQVPVLSSIVHAYNTVKSIQDPLNYGAKKKTISQKVFPATIEHDTFHKIVFSVNEIDATGFTKSSRPIENPTSAQNPYGNSPAMYDTDSSHTANIMPAMNDLMAQYKRTSESIVLQIPDNIQSNYGVSWKQSDLGMASRLANVVQSGFSAAAKDENQDAGMFSKLASGASASGGALLDLISQSLPQAASGVMQQFTGVNFADLLERSQGRIVNPLIEILFDSILNREFSLNFRFFPKNETESESVNAIVNSFKRNMHPEVTKGAKSFLKYPNTFDIAFLTHDNKPNPFLFKISTCALTSLTFNPISDSARFISHKNGSPVVSTLTLSFKELEQLTSNRFDDPKASF
jgi:hypothetical protein